MENQKNAKCPNCAGSGTVPNFNPLSNTERERVAVDLRGAGYSIRHIAEIMGYKSPRSVQQLLGKETPTGTTPEEILEKSASEFMVDWSQRDFKRTHPKLYLTIIESIKTAQRQIKK